MARAASNGGGTVALGADTEVAIEAESCPHTGLNQGEVKETAFTDDQFSSGLAPPSYSAASDYKTVPVSYTLFTEVGSLCTVILLYLWLHSRGFHCFGM